MDALSDYQIVLDLGALLIIALCCSALFEKLRMPSLMGMLIAGIIIGPFASGFQVLNKDIIMLIGQLGAILILFGVGLQFEYQSISRIWVRSLALAVLAGSAGFIAGVLLGILLGWNHAEVLLLGALFVSTSTTIALKMMEETLPVYIRKTKGEEMTKAAIVFDDLYGFIVLALVLGQLDGGTALNADALILVAKILLPIAIVFIAGIFLIPKVSLFIENIFKRMTFVFWISFCFLLSYVLFTFDISPIVGAFFAGTLLTSTTRYRELSKSILPICSIFAVVFFVSVGLLVEPSAVISVLPVALVISIVAICSKALMFSFVLRLFKVPSKDAVRYGLLTGPRGEVSLIIAQTAAVAGWVGSVFVGVAASMVLITTLMTPILLRVANGYDKFQLSHV